MNRIGVRSRPHWILLQNPGEPTPDGDGGYVEGFLDLVPSHAFAEIKPATTAELERLASGTVMSTASHIVTFPYHPGVSVETRIVHGTRVFQVTGVSDPEELHIETIALCVELVGAVPFVDRTWVQSEWMQ